MGLPDLNGLELQRALIDFCYFAAETYSTLAYGAWVPSGALRVIACVEPLNGVLLLTLSGAFLSGDAARRLSDGGASAAGAQDK